MLGIGIGINRQKPIFSRIDPAVNAFLTATGITRATEVNAVTNLVANLKSYGLWSKMKAIYPFVSDTVNLLSYTEDLTNGTWQKTQTTITANATNDPNGNLTADKLVENTTNNNHNVFQQATIGNVQMTFSVYLKKAERSYCYVNMSDLSTGDASIKVDLNTGTLSATGIAVGSWTNISSSIVNAGNGWFRVSLTATKGAGTISQPYIVLLNNSQATPYLGDGTSGLFVWGSQLEQASSASTYQPIATTPANRFVSQFKYNLKDARDLDAAFRLAFNGTWTYSKQGATGNGVNGYADTFFNPNNALTINSGHATVYSRTQTPKTTNQVLRVTDGTNDFQISPNINVTGFGQYSAIGGIQVVNVANTDARGFYQSQRTSATSLKSFKNTTLSGTNTLSGTHTYPNFKIFLGSASVSNVPTNYSDIQTAFATIGDGLTDTEATNLYTSVQSFQQALSRQV